MWAAARWYPQFYILSQGAYGTAYCPGRFLAKREVYMFVATVLFRFDIKLAPGTEGGKVKIPKIG